MRSVQDLVSLIAESGLFDAEWYLKEYPDVSILGMNPIEHYLRYGEMLGRNPSTVFDTRYYLQTYPDVAKQNINPLYHFLTHGKSEGRLPSGINTKKETSGELGEVVSLLAESDLFDAEWYLKEYPDVSILGMNPIEHYLRYGEMLGRNPSTAFDTRYYLRAYPDIAEHQINPLYHFIIQGRSEGRLPCGENREHEDTEIQPENDVSNYFMPLLEAAPLVDKPVRLIAFYLPQFHPIPENNDWWGDGFTEWTNVQPAQPQFAGHYQPRIPGELGYYNLLDLAVQRRQVELAKLYGIGGFCFYFYWFGGKRLLETPIENYLNEQSLDLPFCLCWANENWSRRWDGLDNEILIAQQHSPEDDLAFIQHTARYMRDERYIRIDDKPLLLVYRPSLLPSPMETSERWRAWCRANGMGEIYLAYTQAFEAVDPAIYGFDAAIEFPPNNSAPPNVTHSVTPLTDDFNSIIYDWRALAERSHYYRKPEYTLFRGVCPSWDNTARRKNKGTVLLNSSPHHYRTWLSNAIGDTCQRFSSPDERLIFVNAWNEWAEGAHLEPDAHHGYAYLQATRNALNGGEVDLVENSRKITLVAHDAYPHGAQLLVLNLAKTLSQGLGFHVDLVCLGDGPLKAEYVKWAAMHDLTGLDARGPEAIRVARKLYEAGNRSALVNTTVSGYFLETLANNGFECVALIHELRGVLDQFALHGQARTIAKHATRIVFPAEEVAASFTEVAPMEAAKIVIRPQGLYKRRRDLPDRTTDRLNLRKKLGLPDDSQIVLGVGYADYRKGIDLFVEAGLKMAQRNPRACWVWIGHWEKNMQDEIDKTLAKFPSLSGRFRFPGLQSDTDLFYGGADIFALTSREDPFPSVVLEAMDAGLPVVGFDGAGGFIGLLNEGCGRLVAKEDVAAFTDVIGNMLESSHERNVLGLCGKELISVRFSFRHYIYDLLDFVNQPLRRVSAVVPNYNYAHYLPERLSSIINQSHPIFEIIFLDDCSTDDSIGIAKDFFEAQAIDYKIIVNKENSGSVFSQWKKGVDVSNGTHIWIAEADDLADNQFLSALSPNFVEPNLVLAFSQSKQIDETGKILAENYLNYTKDVADYWQADYLHHGHYEIGKALSIKNTIPNVSAVLFRRDALKQAFTAIGDDLFNYRVAGDWLLYLYVLKQGAVYFCAKPLNLHRRHTSSVTKSLQVINHFQEVCQVQKIARYMVELSPEVGAKADIYIEYLRKYFGLQENEGESAV